MKKVISGFAEKLLARICAGEKTQPNEDGSWRVGHRCVPPSVIASLERADFVRRSGKRLEPTQAGRRYLARSDWSRSSDRTAGGATRGGTKRKRTRTTSRKGAEPILSAWRAQHMIVRHPGSRTGRGGARDEARPLRNLAETPLAWLARHRDRRGRPFLDERLIAAGERLRADFEMAGLRPRTTVTYTPVGSERGRRAVPADGIACGRIDAHRRFTRALETVGPGLCDILIEVCCFLQGMEAAERQLGWPQRAGKLVLKLALERLADHYDGRRPALSLAPELTYKEKIY